MIAPHLHIAPLLVLAAVFALFLVVGLAGRRPNREYYP